MSQEVREKKEVGRPSREDPINSGGHFLKNASQKEEILPRPRAPDWAGLATA